MDYDKAWWTVFVAFFIGTAFAETLLPLRSLPSSTPRRWINNSTLLVASALVVACAYQFTGIALAFAARSEAYGVLNLVRLPYWLRFLTGLAALDLTAYLSHRLMHAASALWRVHQVHHSETDLDLVSGFRFHPMEALVTQACRLICIALIGVPPGAVGFSALVVVAVDFVTHANIRVAGPLDRLLRWLLVTPSMHHTHHRREIAMQSANFGNLLSIWDRIFGTYQDLQPADDSLQYGLAEFADGSNLNAAALLLLPFRGAPKAAAVPDRQHTPTPAP